MVVNTYLKFVNILTSYTKHRKKIHIFISTQKPDLSVNFKDFWQKKHIILRFGLVSLIYKHLRLEIPQP